MIVKPLKDKVLIAEGKKDTTTDSGIILDGRGLGNTTPGIVVAVGPDVKEVKEGDTVYLDWSKSSPVNVDGAQRVMISEKEIIAVIEQYGVTKPIYYAVEIITIRNSQVLVAINSKVGYNYSYVSEQI